MSSDNDTYTLRIPLTALGLRIAHCYPDRAKVDGDELVLEVTGNTIQSMLHCVEFHYNRLNTERKPS